jgi:short-subunit dehydrogenase
MWESPESVARTGIDALARNRPVAIPGTANRVAANLSTLAPKRLLLPILRARHPGLQD